MWHIQRRTRHPFPGRDPESSPRGSNHQGRRSSASRPSPASTGNLAQLQFGHAAAAGLDPMSLFPSNLEAEAAGVDVCDLAGSASGQLRRVNRLLPAAGRRPWSASSGVNLPVLRRGLETRARRSNVGQTCRPWPARWCGGVDCFPRCILNFSQSPRLGWKVDWSANSRFRRPGREVVPHSPRPGT